MTTSADDKAARDGGGDDGDIAKRERERDIQ